MGTLEPGKYFNLSVFFFSLQAFRDHFRGPRAWFNLSSLPPSLPSFSPLSIYSFTWQMFTGHSSATRIMPHCAVPFGWPCCMPRMLKSWTLSQLTGVGFFWEVISWRALTGEAVVTCPRFLFDTRAVHWAGTSRLGSRVAVLTQLSTWLLQESGG